MLNDKLPESIPSSNVKILELFNKIENYQLIPNPDFQRKLVWKKQHKYHFIETILLNFPFPEIFIASEDIDVDAFTAKEIVVDGQQRLTTIRDYIKGEGDFKEQSVLTPFAKLKGDEKKAFLNYYVSVRDLKDLKMDQIKEIFQRINNTEYSLNTVEKKNAQYGDGEFLIFCKQITDLDTITTEETDVLVDIEKRKFFVDFWEEISIFDDNDNSRMLALQYISNLVVSILEPEYFHRNLKTQNYISEYNSEFTKSELVLFKLEQAVDFIKKIGLDNNSYWFKKPNFFNLVVELSRYENLDQINITNFKRSLENIETLSNQYFAKINLQSIDEDYKLYFEYAKQGINDKKQRLHRGQVVEKLITENLIA